MSKRRKAQTSEEDKEMSISKAKKNLRRKTQLTEERNPTCGSPSNTIIAGTNQECQGSSPENAETDKSFTEEGKKASFQKKKLDHTKALLSPSQGKKLVPVFRKSKKTLTEGHEKIFGEAATILKEQVQHMDRNMPDIAKKDVQNNSTSSKSLQLIDLLTAKVEEAEDQVTFPCEELKETLNVKMQDQDNITKLNNDDANSGLVGSHEGIGTETEPNVLVSICEKEMPEKHVTCTPDRNGVNGLEKRELSLESLICPFAEKDSVVIYAKEKMTDYIEGSPKENKHPNSLNINMEQNKVIQDATDDIKEASWNKSERSEDNLVESMALQTSKENITLLPLVTNVSVSTPGEQSNYVYTSSRGKQGSTDAREADQYPHYRTGKTEEENNICTTTDIFQPGATRYSSTNGERATDQHNPWMHGKPIEQSGRDKTREHSSPHQIDTFVTKQNLIKDHDTAWKDLPEIRPVYICLEKEDFCEQVLQPEVDVISKSRKISVEEIICSEERQIIKNEAEVKATPAKSTTASPDPKAAALLTEQANKNSYENLLPTIKHSNTNACDLIPSEIMETISNTDIAQHNFIEIPKTEEITIESSLLSTDIHINRKKEITCMENENMLLVVESGISSAEVLPMLETMDDSGREIDADPKAKSISLASTCAPSGVDAVAQTCTSYTELPSLDLGFLPDSQLQGVFESHSLEFPPHKASILDNQCKPSKNKSDVCSVGGQSGTKTLATAANKTHPNSVRDQVLEGICDSSREEDATDIVCGLIKELSNLNRLTMSMHRDLDSFKRMKFRRNRQSSKFLPHSVNNMTSTLSIARKKRESCSL